MRCATLSTEIGACELQRPRQPERLKLRANVRMRYEETLRASPAMSMVGRPAANKARAGEWRARIIAWHNIKRRRLTAITRVSHAPHVHHPSSPSPFSLLPSPSSLLSSCAVSQTWTRCLPCRQNKPAAHTPTDGRI